MKRLLALLALTLAVPADGAVLNKKARLRDGATRFSGLLDWIDRNGNGVFDAGDPTEDSNLNGVLDIGPYVEDRNYDRLLNDRVRPLPDDIL